MPFPRRSRGRVARAALAGSLLLFAGLQFSLTLVMEDWLPALRDPEYGCKAVRLRTLLTEEPGRPLVVVLGSSRSLLGIRPDLLTADWTGPGREPTAFNYAFTGCGPIMELVCLHRLLRGGVRPDGLLLEIHPALLHQEDGYEEERWIPPERLGWNDLRVRWRYSAQPWVQGSRWLESRLVPASSKRFCIMSHLAPDWLPWGESRQDGWLSMDRWGWLPNRKKGVTAEEYTQGAQRALKEYCASFLAYRITDRCDRAVRELLDICRRERIRVALVTLPEGTMFQAAFPPHAHAVIRDCLLGWSAEYDVPWIDARSWLPDPCFSDGHHLLPVGARLLSQRLRYEAMPQVLAAPEVRRQVVHRAPRGSAEAGGP
jgi:hypothetical protein